MFTSGLVYMLAADHRWQWEEWCDTRGVPRPRITEVKQLTYDGFMQARELSPDVQSHGALLLDEQYASAIIERAVQARVPIGTPAEKAGTFPLAWATDPMYLALTGSFVKVLVRFRPDDDELIREAQWEKLKALSGWCRQAGKPLVVEVLVARRHEPEEEFEATGRASIISGFIGQAYRRNLVPQFWKIEGTASPDGARIVDDAVAAHPAGRQILLGKGADFETIDRWFAAAARGVTAAGFAIGRSVFWDPCAAYLSGTRSAEEAVGEIAAGYLRLVDAWKRAQGSENVGSPPS
jgi:myo-inositol catabolism protein IolC